LDSRIAMAGPTKDKIAMEAHYSEWGVALPKVQLNKKLTVMKGGVAINLQKNFNDKQASISGYNKHVAVNLTNLLKPKHLRQNAYVPLDTTDL